MLSTYRQIGFNFKIGPALRFLLRTAVLCFFAPLATAGQYAETTPAGTRMWIYTPPSYSATQNKFPLIIFLHGEKQTGDDLSLLTAQSNHLLPGLISGNRWDSRLPFIVVSPQLKRDHRILNPKDQQWSAAYIDEVVEFVKRNYRIDFSRIYLTGVSTGATACWTYAARYPGNVAAMVPIAAHSDPSRSAFLKDIPVWAFHGENDFFTSSYNSALMFKTVAGKFKPRLNLLAAKGHEAWPEIYNGESGYNIYAWFLKFHKGSIANVFPYVNAGVDHKVQASAEHHSIAGDFFDWDGRISMIRWSQTSGPPVVLQGINGAFLNIANLKPGVFEFQLTVTDNSGAVAKDRVRLEVVEPRRTIPRVTSLVLINGKLNTDVTSLSEGMIVNRALTGDNDFNLRANVTAGVASVRFRINADASVRTSSGVPHLIKKTSKAPEWIPANGTCVVCATPYSQPGGKGVEGVTLCYRIVVSNSALPSERSRDAQVDAPLTVRLIDDVIFSNLGTGNQWVRDGVDIPGATGPVFKPLYPGEYLVRQVSRPSNDVSNVVKFGRSVSKTTTQKIEVYPHPAQGFIQVKAESLPARSSYRILRAGVTVQQGELFDDRKIALAQKLPKGQYVLIVNGKKNADGTKFVIR